jgi:hypothetical protein
MYQAVKEEVQQTKKYRKRLKVFVLTERRRGAHLQQLENEISRLMQGSIGFIFSKGAPVTALLWQKVIGMCLKKN